MLSVRKENLTNSYNYNNLSQKRSKVTNRWMWLVLLGCFLFQMLPYCVALNLTTVFVGGDWQIWTGGNQTVIGLTFTAGALAAAIAGPFIAKMFGKKINMRLVYIIGIILAMIGFAGSSINSIIMYCNGGHVPNIYAVSAILWVSNMISQIGVMIFSGLGVNNLISKWWPSEKRGFALGIAFAGGSLGNIWMQQMVGALSKVFGNGSTTDYNLMGTQFATYIIMAGMGLVAGILVALFVCRKPLAPIDILSDEQFNKSAEGINVNKKATLEASPLNTRKYPPYWILAVGFLILQMGTVHASTNSLFVRSFTYFDRSLDYTQIIATCGTIFGVCCLVGNTLGGILNDKLGPWKSILLAGTLQCVAIVCMMLSAGTPALIYAYSALAGLSVYVYTSTPAFISGRLYGAGQSNNHMSILGIFIAVGFAIVNSISGVLTGTTDPSNIQLMFGNKTLGNLQNLGLYELICMGVGTIIVVICCFIIQSKGIKGLIEYSPTKYTLVLFKHALTIKFGTKRILMSKKDYRNKPKRIEKINQKMAKDPYHNCINEYYYAVDEQFAKNNANDNQLKILTCLYFYGVINKHRLIEFSNGAQEIDENIIKLIKGGYINEMSLANFGNYYQLSNLAENHLAISSGKLSNKFSLIAKANIKINKILTKLDVKQQQKQTHLKNKAAKVNAIEIDDLKKQKLALRLDVKIQKLQAKKQVILNRIQNKDEWTKYQREYEMLQKIVDCENKKLKYDNKKEAKIKAVQTKILTAQYVSNFLKNQQIDGHDLLNNYYNNKYLVIDQLITKRVEDILDNKISLDNHKLGLDANKKDVIEKTLLK